MKSVIPTGTETKAQYAYRVIEELIVTLELPPGSRVSEASLSQRIGIGRTPVREALQRLSRDRSISVLPRSGAIVTEIDVVDHLKLIEVRRGLERVLARRAARLASSEARKQFTELRERFEVAVCEESEKKFISADRDFNRLIVEAANNIYAADAIAPIQAQTRRFWYLYFKQFGDIGCVSRLHADIADSVSRNLEDEAEAASDRLIDYVEEYTQKTLRALMA